MSKPLTRKQLKNLVGYTVALLPTHNSVVRGTELVNQIATDTVESCGTSLVTYTHKGKYPINGYCDRNNYGYLPFATKQDVIDYLTVQKFSNEVYELRSKIRNLSIEQVNQIKSIINQKD